MKIEKSMKFPELYGMDFLWGITKSSWIWQQRSEEQKVPSSIRIVTMMWTLNRNEWKLSLLLIGLGSDSLKEFSIVESHFCRNFFKDLSTLCFLRLLNKHPNSVWNSEYAQWQDNHSNLTIAWTTSHISPEKSRMFYFQDILKKLSICRFGPQIRHNLLVRSLFKKFACELNIMLNFLKINLLSLPLFPVQFFFHEMLNTKCWTFQFLIFTEMFWESSPTSTRMYSRSTRVQERIEKLDEWEIRLNDLQTSLR
jgi:hypothetical protein